jgi:thiamine-monophosphate kinase
MKLRSLGELKLLKEIRKRFNPVSQQKGSDVIVGIGDDAAVFSCPENKILVTTDMMNEGIHFDLSYTSPYQLGFKLVSVNVSDIYAMGGTPRFVFLDTAMSEDTDEEFFMDFFDGVSSALDKYSLKLLGGDISSVINEMSFSATVVGFTETFITRAGAMPGDKIYITGTLGDSASGLEILKRLDPAGREIIKNYNFMTAKDILKHPKSLSLSVSSELKQIDFAMAEPLIRRHLIPDARHPGSIADNATSMIDLSDGLFIDLNRICDESNVGARVYLSKIPLSSEMKQSAEIMGLDPYCLAASGGEDYELLFTLPSETIKATEFNLESLTGSDLPAITCIGEVVCKDRIFIAQDGSESELRAEGYQHFGTPE